MMSHGPMPNGLLSSVRKVVIKKGKEMKRLALVLMAVCGLCLSSCKAMCAESETSEPGKAASETPAKIETKPGPEKPAEEWKTPAAKLSYAFGMEIGSALKGLETDVDFASFSKGVEDVLKGNKALLTAEESGTVKSEFFAKLQEERLRKMQELAEKNKKANEEFLAANKKKEGVKATASGLQYIVVKEGSGANPKLTDAVKVHYTGTLVDNKEFDSSLKRGEPAVFPVEGVIPGWSEALQLMKVGGKYRIFIPSDLAYGEQGAGEMIGPNAVLIFEVELLGIEEQEAEPPKEEPPSPKPDKPEALPKEEEAPKADMFETSPKK